MQKKNQDVDLNQIPAVHMKRRMRKPGNEQGDKQPGYIRTEHQDFDTWRPQDTAPQKDMDNGLVSKKLQVAHTSIDCGMVELTEVIFGTRVPGLVTSLISTSQTCSQ